MKVKFITLGCKTNLYESDAIAETFKAAGHTIADKGETADVYVINTCTVTGAGAQKSRQHIRKAVKENKDAVIVVTGCYAQTESEKVKSIEGVDIVVGNNRKSEIVALSEKAVKGKKLCITDNILKEKRFEELTATSGQSRVRANIKIQDGCNNFCSYCIIPYARGPVRSRRIDSIVKEAHLLAENGFYEVVLTGIHIGSYGRDFDNSITLIDVLEELEKVNGLRRIRLGSIEPVHITPEFTERAKKLKKLCPQFHLSLQSGCDETLKRMNRRYTTAEFRNSVRMLRENIKDVSITTDVMVGFAGETDEEFEKSFEFVREIGFMQMHVFKYSIREGTAAAGYKNQVDEVVKDIRSRRMLALSRSMREEFYSRYIGGIVEAVVEDMDDNRMFNATSANYMNIKLRSDADLTGKCVLAKAKEVKDGYLICDFISEC